MPKYKTRKIEIEAVRFDYKVFRDQSWKPGEVKYYACVSKDTRRDLYMFNSHSGPVTIFPGDYMVKMDKGWAPWNRQFFEKWFEPVKGGRR